MLIKKEDIPKFEEIYRMPNIAAKMIQAGIWQLRPEIEETARTQVISFTGNREVRE